MNKKKPQILRTLTLFLLGSILLLTACSQLTDSTPEMLVLSKVASGNTPIEPDTLKIVFKETMKDHVFLLVRFFSKDGAGQMFQCVGLFETFRDENDQWVVQPNGSECAQVGAFGTIQWGGNSCTDRLFGREDADSVYTFISGQHVLNQADAVSIIWEDGKVQTVKLNENIFFAMREGKVRHQSLDWLDKEGNIISHEENTREPCGIIGFP